MQFTERERVIARDFVTKYKKQLGWALVVKVYNNAKYSSACRHKTQDNWCDAERSAINIMYVYIK